MSAPVPYAAFLRGVSPSNAPSAELRGAFEDAGFDDVRTVRSSGNVLFRAAGRNEEALRRRAESALEARLGRSFPTFIRSIGDLRALIDADPWADREVPDQAKRVVTFLHRPPDTPPDLPLAHEEATVHALHGREVLSSYVPGPRGGAFMRVIERTFGVDVTTRTWDTVRRVAG